MRDGSDNKTVLAIASGTRVAVIVTVCYFFCSIMMMLLRASLYTR